MAVVDWPACRSRLCSPPRDGGALASAAANDAAAESNAPPNACPVPPGGGARVDLKDKTFLLFPVPPRLTPARTSALSCLPRPGHLRSSGGMPLSAEEAAGISVAPTDGRRAVCSEGRAALLVSAADAAPARDSASKANAASTSRASTSRSSPTHGASVPPFLSCVAAVSALPAASAMVPRERLESGAPRSTADALWRWLPFVLSHCNAGAL